MAHSRPIPEVGGVYSMIEAARLKGVSYRTVARAVRRGVLPAQRLGRMMMIAADDLDSWQPMVQRAPHKYQHRRPDPAARPALVDRDPGERIDLARRLILFSETVHAAALSLPSPAFLTLLSEQLCYVLGLTRVTVWTVDGDRRLMIRRASAGVSLEREPDHLPLASVPDFAEYLAHGTVMAADTAMFGAPLVSGRDPSTLVMAPLRLGGRSLGVLVGDSARDSLVLTSDHQDLVWGIAHQTAVALELARLHADVTAVGDRGASIDGLLSL